MPKFLYQLVVVLLIKFNIKTIIKYIKYLIFILFFFSIYYFKVCPTYPKALIVPKTIDDDTIKAASSFREGGRFPILSYRHETGVRYY